MKKRPKIGKKKLFFLHEYDKVLNIFCNCAEYKIKDDNKY